MSFSVINWGFIIEFDEVLLKLQQIIQYMYWLYIKLFMGGVVIMHAYLYIRGRFLLVWKAEKVAIEGKNQFLTPANRSEEIIQCVHIVKLLFLIHVHMIKRIFFGKETISHGFG